MPAVATTPLVLVVGADTPERERVVAALEAADATVEAESDPRRGRDRLAWPDVDAVVVEHSPPTIDATAFVSSIADTYPRMEKFVVGEELDVDATVFEPADTEALATALLEAIRERDERREMGRFDDDGVIEYPNVDEADVEALLAGEIDRETAAELLHKQQLIEAIFAEIPAHVFVKDEHGRHRYVSERYFDEDPEAFLDRADPEIPYVADDHAWRAYEDDRFVIDEGEPILNKEEYLPALDKWNDTSKVPWYHDGEIVGLIGVTHEVTERKERRHELERQNERLREFASVVSHDVRNPLQVAQSALELAEEGDEDALETVANALDRIDAIVDDVRKLAKYGQSVIDPEPIDLSELVAQAWGITGTAQGTLHTEEDLGQIMGDAGPTSQLLENLFRNSVEHGGSDAESAVTVRVGPLVDEGERVGFFVADDGSGIPATERSSVFEAGYSTDADGSGFGLSIVKQIADAHGWTIELDSSVEGGARFEIRDVDCIDTNS